MLNILFLENSPGIGGRVRAEIETTEYVVSTHLDCRDRLAVFGCMEQMAVDVIILCISLEEVEGYLDADILPEIRKAGYLGQILLISEKRSKELWQIALECDVEWVLSWEDEADLIPKALQRVERRHRGQLSERANKIRRLFVDFIKDERRVSAEDKKLLFEEFREAPYFQIVLVRILPPYRKSSFLDENSLVKLKGYEILVSRLEKHGRSLIAEDGSDILVCIMGSQKEQHLAREQLKKYLNDMKEFRQRISHAAVWICMGSQVQNIRDISKSYHIARRLIQDRIIHPDGALLEEQDQPGNADREPRERFQVFDVRKRLENSLETFEESNIHKTLMQLKSNIVSAMNFEGEDLYAIYKTLISVLFRELERREIDLLEVGIDYDTAIREYEYFWNIDDLFNNMEGYYLKGLDILKAQEEERIPASIVLARRYIRAYFNMPLTLQEISSYVGMNENYFSDYFKKYTKMTFKQYQTYLRIRHAKQMLLDKEYTMEDIADAVGYNDVKYFLRVFKQVAGITAGEYRKNITS